MANYSWAAPADYEPIRLSEPIDPANVSAQRSSNSQSESGIRQRHSRGLVVLGGLLSCAALALHRQKRQAAQAIEPSATVRLPEPPQQEDYLAYNSSAEGCLEMPSRSDQYDGIEDERHIDIQDKEDGTASVFAIGDWGATLPNHTSFAGEFGDHDDLKAQFVVAAAMKRRAAWADPQYVLNVGDNFYVGGMYGHTCQDPPDHNRPDVLAKFDSIWVKIYAPVSSKPWLSVLGNHDYGGWRFDSGWPQQIGYSFMNHNWIMPARYYSKRIRHSNFLVDYIMIDSNHYDASEDGNDKHSICSNHNSEGVGGCDKNGGMRDIASCRPWFMGSWDVQKGWVEKKLEESDADWKIVVTHFPCGYETQWYKMLKAKYGLDLIVTGHRHQQELWVPGSPSKYLADFQRRCMWDHHLPVCFVTGGGGGIISEKFKYADYGQDLTWYGFFHLTIHKDWMRIELVNANDTVSGSVTIFPHGTAKSQRQMTEWSILASAGGLCDFACGDIDNPWPKSCATMASCAECATCKI